LSATVIGVLYFQEFNSSAGINLTVAKGKDLIREIEISMRAMFKKKKDALQVRT
jgi:hypothetical protein